MSGGADGDRRGEFELISDCFAPLAAAMPGADNLRNDAATFKCTPGHELVLTKDAMVAGVHFLEGDAPGDIARKLLRVNLSDLAAMGARPVGYLLATFWPADVTPGWIRAFADGLGKDQAEFSIGLLGGDTVRTSGPLSLSLTAIGEVREGRALFRHGAAAGDAVYVSGTIGDAALGLKVLRGELPDLAEEARDYLARRYHLPEPRLALGEALCGMASACADVSDGLLADIGHIADCSGLGAKIAVEALPLSAAARAALDADPTLIDLVLAGGDDYELVFTMPPAAEAGLRDLAVAAKIPLTRIGEMIEGAGVTAVLPDGTPHRIAGTGWRHF